MLEIRDGKVQNFTGTSAFFFSEQTTTLIDGKPIPVYESAEYFEFISSFQQSKRLKDWWKAIKEFVKDHSGSYLFNDCHGNGNCGPCPGMCVRFGVTGGDIIDTNIISTSDFQLGFRSYSISLYKHKESTDEFLLFEFYYPKDFLYNDQLYITDTVTVSAKISHKFSKSEIIIYPGIYSVVYDASGVGATIPNVKMIP